MEHESPRLPGLPGHGSSAHARQLSEVLEAAGLESGTELGVTVEDGQVVLVAREAAERKLRNVFDDLQGSMAEGLIAERHAQAVRDAGAA